MPSASALDIIDNATRSLGLFPGPFRYSALTRICIPVRAVKLVSSKIGVLPIVEEIPWGIWCSCLILLALYAYVGANEHTHLEQQLHLWYDPLDELLKEETKSLRDVQVSSGGDLCAFRGRRARNS